MKNLALMAVILFLFYNCSKDQNQLDGADQVSFNQSVDLVSKDLPALQQKKFKEAIQLIYEYGTSKNNPNRWNEVRTMLNDKTATQVFDLAEGIAKQNNFDWNRNQAPYANGLPSEEPEQAEPDALEAKIKSPIQEAVSMDLVVELQNNIINIYPSFYTQNAKSLQFDKTLDNILVEVFSDNNLVKSLKGKLTDYRDTDPEMGGDGIVLPLSYLDPSKIKSQTLKIKVTVPHPENYLAQQKTITVPASMVGYKKPIKDTTQVATAPIVNDSLQQQPKKDIDELVSVALVKRFMSALKSNNLGLAYGFTKSPKWTSYKAFSNAFANHTGASVSQVQYVGKSDNQTKAVAVVTKDNQNKKIEFSLNKINGKWLIVNANLPSTTQDTKTEVTKKDSARLAN